MDIQMINIGLIGFGYWGPNVAKNIHANKNLKLYAICDYKEDRLEKAKSIYIEQTTYQSDYKKLLSNPDIEAIAVAVETMKEREDKDILDISAVIFCERDSHKGIVIGKGGSMLKRAATLSRQDLEEFFQIKVNLKCWVKVKEDWRNRDAIIRTLGLSDN